MAVIYQNMAKNARSPKQQKQSKVSIYHGCMEVRNACQLSVQSLK
jgi:hypothetical protein